MLGGWSSSAGRRGRGVGVAQPGEEKAAGSLQGVQEGWGGLLGRGCRDRIWGDGFKVKEGGFGLDPRQKFFTMRAVTAPT